MKKANVWKVGAVALASVMVLGACGGGGGTSSSSDKKDSGSGSNDAAHSVALITDTGGVDDKSFNQSAW